jgi:molybdenum cofactor cytidylyltransferase
MNCIIILAAGASSRMGRAKQTLDYKEQSLLKHAIQAAVDSAIGPVVVVIGANQKLIQAHISNQAVLVVINKHYEEGISTSIHAGVTYLLETYEDCENIILMVCDQPYVDSDLLKSLVDTRLRTNKAIVACTYNDTVGVPALFSKLFFSDLLSLKADEGGKKILLKNAASVVTIPFPAGYIDIDTVADYEALLARK